MHVTALAFVVAAVAETSAPAPSSRDLPCPACGYACAQGSVNCWGCGTRLADLKSPAGFVRVEPLSILGTVRPRFVSAEELTPPALVVERLRDWVRSHPADFDEAEARIKAAEAHVKGTEEEAALGALLADVKRRREAHERPENPEERQKVVAREVDRVMVEVALSPLARAFNIAKLEKLLEIAKGTVYERLVRDQLEVERAKLP
jgi:hypothetical protein